MLVFRAYDPEPTYRALGAELLGPWNAATADLPAGGILAVDDRGTSTGRHCSTTSARPSTVAARVTAVNIRDHMVGSPRVLQGTAPVAELADGPYFATLAGGALADVFDAVPGVTREPHTLVVVRARCLARRPHAVLHGGLGLVPVAADDRPGGYTVDSAGRPVVLCDVPDDQPAGVLRGHRGRDLPARRDVPGGRAPHRRGASPRRA